jgi:hypothetical protein
VTAVQQDSSDQVMQQLYKREIEPKLDSLPINSAEGFKKLCADPKYTFMESALYYKTLRSQKFIHCDVIGVPGTNLKESVSMVIRKGSPYMKFLNHKLVYFFLQSSCGLST